MPAVALYRAFRGYLRLSYRLVRLAGEQINVDERFMMRFTVANQAPDPAPVENPVIIFNKTRVTVEATPFARPVAGPLVSFALPDAQLLPGEAGFVDVEMIALQSIGGIVDLFAVERVAKAWATADVDQAQYFMIWQYSDVHQEIEPT